MEEILWGVDRREQGDPLIYVHDQIYVFWYEMVQCQEQNVCWEM